ncbi:MAG TPA: hypothetical protein VKA01_13470, partial [Vicinamibacteria bacterium]|nr:hypothetical protein [Vicinamibacteria bacterium]
MALGGSRSIRTKLVFLTALVAVMTGGIATVFSGFSNRGVLREELVKRGNYIALNLAYNSKYGVLTEDKPLLSQLLEGAMSSVAGQSSDVVGAMIRDQQGGILAQKGFSVKNLPSTPAKALESVDAVTDQGESAMLFRAPVTTTASGGGGMAAELG